MPDTPSARGVLRPLPFRGDLIAAGAVALTVGVLVLDLRMQGSWAAGVRCVVVAAAAALLLALAWRAPVEDREPRLYVSVLLSAAFPLTAVALAELAGALGGGVGSAGSATWVLVVLAALYAALARARGSAICTLLAAGAAVAALLAAWSWIFDPESVTAYRWLLLAVVAALALGAIRLRDRHRRHAVSLIDVVGLSAVTLGVTLWSESAAIGGVVGGAGWGWQLVLLALGFALVAYATADRERGPAWLGATALALFVVAAADHGSLLWWPLLLIVLGAGVVAAGLRPTTPAPPPPDADAPAASTRPLDPGSRG